MNSGNPGLTRQFLALELDPARFGHLDHVQVAYDLVREHGFLEASNLYASAIETMAARAGAPEKFNLTITLAFLSLIAERLGHSAYENFEDYLAHNEDLMSSHVLEKWYTKDRLMSAFARSNFLLPDKVMQ